MGPNGKPWAANKIAEQLYLSEGAASCGVLACHQRFFWDHYAACQLVRAGKLSASTLQWFWSQPIALDTLACASGMNETSARMFIIASLTHLARSQDSV
jgi:hypothetical protein